MILLQYTLDFYHLFYYFLFYSFLGWCLECCYAYSKQKNFINRGFLNGPFCPVYGFGILSIIILANPIINLMPNNAIIKNGILFIYTVIITSAIEYFTGFLLETFFKTTWWDYKKRPFNIKGRICLKFSIIWGLISLVILNKIHPFVHKVISLIPINIGIKTIYVALTYFFIDGFITLKSLVDLRYVLIELEYVSFQIRQDALRFRSNLKHIKETILEDVSDLKDECIEELLKEKDEKIRNLFIKRKELINKLNRKHERLLKAFPNLKFSDIHILKRNLKK